MGFRAHGGLTLDARGLRAAFAERGRVPRNILDVHQFRVDGGSQVAICGPSGSGKTTLLHLFAGLERPRRGIIRWGEVEVTAFPERVADRWRRETVGLVFQQFHLFPGLSALENVLLPLRFDRWSIEPALRTRALKLLERVGVRPDGDVAALSRGEQQRVAVARALLRKPAMDLLPVQTLLQLQADPGVAVVAPVAVTDSYGGYPVHELLRAVTFAFDGLLVTAVLLVIVAVLSARRQSVGALRALGAPPAFVFVTVWLQGVLLIGAGVLFGLALGFILASAMSAFAAAQLGFDVDATIGAPELALCAAVLVAASLLAAAPSLPLLRVSAAHLLRLQ